MSSPCSAYGVQLRSASCALRFATLAMGLFDSPDGYVSPAYAEMENLHQQQYQLHEKLRAITETMRLIDSVNPSTITLDDALKAGLVAWDPTTGKVQVKVQGIFAVTMERLVSKVQEDLEEVHRRMVGAQAEVDDEHERRRPAADLGMWGGGYGGFDRPPPGGYGDEPPPPCRSPSPLPPGGLFGAPAWGATPPPPRFD